MADTTAPPRNDLYETDFYEWTQEQARLLRERRWDDLDLENLIDEVESVGRSDKHQIQKRLKVVLAHLLKWKYQPGARSSAWRGTLREQRARLAQLVEDSPSLRSHPASVFDLAYLSARLLASKETGIDFTLFPEKPPFTPEQALDDEFLPKEPDLLDQS
jgi:hypothetical protein